MYIREPRIKSNKIRKIREEGRLKQVQLATLSKIWYSRFSFIENNYIQPNDNELARIAAALNCDVADLIDEPAEE